MIELTKLLAQLKQQQLQQSTSQPLYHAGSEDDCLIDQAIFLAEALQHDLDTANQIIKDIRTRDANKKCLCRGQ